MAAAGRWIAVLGDRTREQLERRHMRELPVAASEREPRPDVGDLVAFLHRGRFVGIAKVTKLLAESPRRFRLRPSVSAPVGAAPSFTAFSPRLRCSLGWTYAGLDDRTESFIPIEERDHARIADALLALALRFGPPARRPAHRRPRTPGRRPLVAASSTALRRPRPAGGVPPRFSRRDARAARSRSP